MCIVINPQNGSFDLHVFLREYYKSCVSALIHIKYPGGTFASYCQDGMTAARLKSRRYKFCAFECVHSLTPTLASKNASESTLNFQNTQVEGEDSTTTVVDITTFEDDAGVVTASPGNATLNASLFSGTEQQTIINIKSIMERPHLWYGGTLLPGDTFGTIGGFARGMSLVPGVHISRVAQFLQNIAGIRFDLEYTVVVNATRFAQGLYGLFYVPTGGTNPSNGLEWANAHAANYICRSQLPHVRLDLNCDTKAVLEIPWSSHFSFMPLSNLVNAPGDANVGQLGYVFLAPIANGVNGTTIAPATESANYTIYSRFKNVQFSYVGTHPQMDISVKEAKSKNAGPVESTALKVSKALGFISKAPLLTSYVKPLQWMADTTANVASVFGWSRPTNDSTMVRVKRLPFGYVGNVDELDNSAPMSLSTKNKVEVLAGFTPDEHDELDINYFSSRWSIYTTYIWSTANAGNFEIAQIANGPWTFRAGTFPNQQFLPMSLPCNFFNKWRGSIKYRFKFVKTEFHSGRLEFVFVPSFAGLPSTYSAVDNYREIVDLRYQSIVEFEIPFVSNVSWLPTNQLNTDITTGVLHIRVVDPLVAPPTASPTVTIVVEVCGGDDLQFAQPTANSFRPQAGPITPQMDVSACGTVKRPIGGMAKNHTGMDYISSSIGENISNFRLLLKKFTSMSVDGSPTIDPAHNAIEVHPFVINTTSTGVSNSGFSNNADLYSVLGSIFLYSRGGVRIKYVNRIPVIRSVTTGSVTTRVKNIGYVYYNRFFNTNAVPFPQVYNTVTEAEPTSRRLTNVVSFFNPEEEFGCEVFVPQYTNTHSRNNSEFVAGPGRNFPHNATSSTNAAPVIRIVDPSLESVQMTGPTGGQTYSILRAAAEDTNFGYFVSIPPMEFVQTM